MLILSENDRTGCRTRGNSSLTHVHCLLASAITKIKCIQHITSPKDLTSLNIPCNAQFAQALQRSWLPTSAVYYRALMLQPHLSFLYMQN